MLHDAWQYLDTRYGLRALGALRVNLERAPSAHRLAHLAEHARAHDARCLIAEPQFSMRPVETFARDIGIAVAVVDPIGMEDEPGPELYFATMRRNFERLGACLAPEAS